MNQTTHELPLRRGRWRVALVAMAAGLALSGSNAPPAGLAPGPLEVAAEPAGLPEAIRNELTRLNPHLAPAWVDRIQNAIQASSERHGLDPALILAVIEVESHGRPEARSPKGALGLMQVMPYMMRPMGLAGNATTIEANIEAGCMILSGNIRRLGEADGISSYFWGSQIRGVGYLNRVRAARERVERALAS
ncbi:MAG: lytic transglycosylase domain-containing protein [bacterium]|nr:lytic transglycosylase domain-containing protein [bacterium]